ncbi:VRR-NUC domain-containing protein [Roseivirga sp. BDSF3-8]|uniref:VRR-NUC domain-containing protein n=1 Tax=Roseivirga sp. BDSF3-8 TaxID=3241598 RepID=UPI0035325AB9
MAAKAPPIILPPLYYLTYFRYLTGFVREKYAHILQVQETGFLDDFASMSQEAQCLFVRLVIRRGRYFPLHRLIYEEIKDLNRTVDELVSAGFASTIEDEDPACLKEILYKLTKDEIFSLLKTMGDDTVRKSWSKSRLADSVTSYAFEEILSHLSELVPMIKCGKTEETEMIFFLFFGNLDHTLSEFVVRDIGYVKLEEIKAEHLTAQFTTRMEAEQKLFLCRAYATYRLLRDGLPPDELVAWFEEVANSVTDWTAPARPVLDKLAVKMGRLLERLQEPDLAKVVYGYTVAPPARERLVRLYRSEGDEGLATDLAQQILDHPCNAEEYYFARDYLQTGSTRSRIKRSMTALLKDSDEIHIEATHKPYVEGGTLNYFLEQGYTGYHCENYLWRSLFGLVFWEELFDGGSQALHHPLQRTPSDLYHGGFFREREERLRERLRVMDYLDSFENYTTRFFSEKEGITNPFIGWHEHCFPSLMACYKLVGAGPLSKVLLEMCRNVKENGRGFPDLFVFRDNSYEFIEVKSPTDQLSAQQLYWLEFFAQAGINARVLRVAFA